MFVETVTVFNYYEESVKEEYEEPEGGYWYAHVLVNVHLETDKGQILRKYGPDCTDSAILHIPCTGGSSTLITADGTKLPWLPPKAWKAQEEDARAASITFGPDDFFMKGAWSGSSVIDESEYADRLHEGFLAYMNREQDFVYKVSSVSGPYSVIPHFEISGK